MDPWDLDMVAPQQRGLNLDIDLNFAIQTPLDLSLGLSTYSYSSPPEVQAHRWPPQQISNATEVLDDEISIISPQDFAQATENSERKNSRGRRELAGQATGILEGWDAGANLCSNCKSMSDGCQPGQPGSSSKKKADNACLIPESPHYKEPVFSCPICMGPLVEPTSTKCGHIFCSECLQKSLKSLHNKCPTCRQKIGKRAIFRIYLPATY